VNASSALANGLWVASALPVWARYRRWLDDPARQQAARLARYLHENRDTAFGRAHRFDRIDSVRAYQERVPIRAYDELAPYIDRIAAGEPKVLTAFPVRRFAFTSGSTTGAKLVPYTHRLVRELSRGVAVWIADLFLHDPRLAGGPAYWSITPLGKREPRVPTNVPVGFDDDTEYLGRVSRRLAAATLAVPREVREIEAIDVCRYVTLLFLLRAVDLRIVSVWHPSFFTLLLDALETWWPRLLDDLARGTLTPPVGVIPEAVARRLAVGLRPERRRAEALARVDPRNLRAIWPSLGLISSWTDGPARLHLAELERRARGIRVQGKGLVATEAFVTAPFGDGLGDARPLALQCHVFEFLRDDGRVALPHEVETDGTYSIVVTTGGGLYRYRLQDRVRVTGWVGRTPSLEFVGKEEAIADLVGEKLSEGFVSRVLQQIFAEQHLEPRFALLAPETASASGQADANGADERGAPARADVSLPVAYTLFVDVGEAMNAAQLDALERALERGLRENPHYAYAVDLGQLAPARIVRVGAEAQAAYLARRTRDGLRVGDIKPAALSREGGWMAALNGSSGI
jgi:GH3 auxin-responsive promoter